MRLQTAEPDQTLAARVVLRDWNTGNFPRFTLPPSSTTAPNSNTADTALTKVYAKDESILSRLKTRSEFRKSVGLVKMTSGEIDKRTLIFDVEWVSPEDSEPSEDNEDEDEEMLDFYGNDGDDEEEEEEDGDEEKSKDGGDDGEDEDEDESEIEPPPLPSKRKRPAEPLRSPTAPQKKRVAFDLQKLAKGAGPPPKHTPPNPKKPILASKK